MIGDRLMLSMTMREWYASHAPIPTQEAIERERLKDEQNIPTNRKYSKPPPRKTREIVADLAFKYADAMIAASQKGRPNDD